MSDYITNDTELTSIADAIRTKGGTSASLVYPSGFISAINAIPTGTSITVESLTVTQNGTYSAPTGKAYDPVIVAVQGGVVVTESTLANGGIVKSISAASVISGTLSITSNGTFDVASYTYASVNVAGSAPNLSSLTVTPTEAQQAFTPATGFDGYSSVTVNGISSNYVGSNVPRKSAANITASGLMVTVPAGYYSLQALKTVTPTFTTAYVQPTESDQLYDPPTGFDGFSQFTVLSISSNYVGTAVARKSSADLTASGSTVTVPVGYYSAQATKNVASGTEGTPTATKGTVSNNSISVTPAVTNTAGYISGGTKTGTAVTVSASELVSGTLSITSNNTYNVTNYASVSVAIPFVTYYTGSSDPSSSLGSDNDIYLKVVS